MQLTLYSILMANLFVSVFTLFFLSFRNNISFLLDVGTNSIIILYLLCILRILLPIEFPFTRVVQAPIIMNRWNYLLYLQIANTRFQYIHIAKIIWITIALYLLFHYLICYFKLINTIKNVPSASNKIIDKLLSIYYPEKKIKYYIVSESVIHTPIQIGITNPIILFPNIDYSEKDLQYICSHEITHIRNRDNLIKLFAKLLICFFWWNPFCYLLLHELNRIQEYKCDYIVTNNLSVHERADYLETLLKFYSHSYNRTLLVTGSALTFYSNGNEILKRFKLVANTKRPQFLLSVCSIVFCIILFIGSYCIVVQPAFNAPNEEGLLIDKTNTVIQYLGDDQYEVITDGHTISIITKDLADELHATGIQYIMEDIR